MGGKSTFFSVSSRSGYSFENFSTSKRFYTPIYFIAFNRSMLPHYFSLLETTKANFRSNRNLVFVGNHVDDFADWRHYFERQNVAFQLTFCHPGDMAITTTISEPSTPILAQNTLYF
jgi:hypothetical protein